MDSRNGEILAFEVRIPPLAGIDGKEKRQVGIVGIECPLFAQIELPIAGDGGEERIQEVVAFFIEKTIMPGEELLKLGYRVLDLQTVFVVDHDGERVLAEVLAFHTKRGQGGAQFGNSSLLGVVDQLVFWAGVLLVLKIRDKTGF